MEMKRYITTVHGTVVHLVGRMIPVDDRLGKWTITSLCGMIPSNHDGFRRLTKLEKTLFEATNYSYLCRTCAEKMLERGLLKRNVHDGRQQIP